MVPHRKRSEWQPRRPRSPENVTPAILSRSTRESSRDGSRPPSERAQEQGRGRGEVRESQIRLAAFTFLVGFGSLPLLILIGNFMFQAPPLRLQALGYTCCMIRARDTLKNKMPFPLPQKHWSGGENGKERTSAEYGGKRDAAEHGRVGARGRRLPGGGDVRAKQILPRPLSGERVFQAEERGHVQRCKRTRSF